MFFRFIILGSPCGGSELQGTSPVLFRVTCVGGRDHSQTGCLPPAHRWGHSKTGVYLTFPSSRGRTHCGMVWPLSELLAHCQACGAALMGSGQGCISRGGSTSCTGAGGEGLACFAVGSPLGEGRCSTRREADPSEGWIHRSTALGLCAMQTSSVTGTGSLWNFIWGWERGMVLVRAFVPTLS